MTENELILVLNRLEEYYRSFYSGSDKARVMNAWYPMFKDDLAEEVNRAVITYICTERYAPTVADIKLIMAELRMAGQMTEMQAWSRIRKAINDAGSRNDAIEAFSKLPSILQKLVCEPAQLRQWRVCDDNTLEGVIASNVQRSYRELARREAVWYTIPGQLQSEQTWRVDAPGLTALPVPEKQLTHEERMEKMEQDKKEYREKYLTLGQDKTDRVNAFKAPLTHAELKMHEAKEKADEKRRLDKMKERLEGRR